MGTMENARATPTRASAGPEGARSPPRFSRKNSHMSPAIAQSPTYGAQTQKSSLSIIPFRTSGAIFARSSAVAEFKWERMSCCARTMPHMDPTGLNICAKLSRLTAVSSSPSDRTYGLHVVSRSEHPPATMNIAMKYMSKLCAMHAGM